MSLNHLNVVVCVQKYVLIPFSYAQQKTQICNTEKERERHVSSFNGKLYILFYSTITIYIKVNNAQLHNVRFWLIYLGLIYERVHT